MGEAVGKDLAACPCGQGKSNWEKKGGWRQKKKTREGV